MGSGQAKKLLIVDDNPRLLTMLEMRFSQAGYQTTVMERVKDALIAAITDKPDLIIADVKIPEISGWEFKKLLNNVPGMAETPFIFLTTDESLPLESYTEEFGPIDHLRKPYSFEELLAKVETNLRRKTKRDETKSVQSETSEGTLEDMTLVDVMQVLAMNRKTCSVTLTKGQSIGKIYFREGRLLDAEMADQQGDEAVYGLLSWKGADFSIGEEPKNSIRESVTRDLHALIAEGLQRIERAVRTDSAAVFHEPKQLAEIPLEPDSPPVAEEGLPKELTASPAVPSGRPENPKSFLERMKKLGLVQELDS